MLFPFVNISYIDAHMDEIKKLKVSIRAREPDQFLDQYRKYGKNISKYWLKNVRIL